ncbi:unnamed protein product, partial [Rotaria sordida]
MSNKRNEFFKVEINKNSLLNNILNNVHNKTYNHIIDDLIEMLTDENNFNCDSKSKEILYLNNEFLLKSKRMKIIHYCKLLKKSYEFIGHYPLEQYYHLSICYFEKEKNSLSYKINSNLIINEKEINKFPLSLFPISSGNGIKKLNDRINEHEFFLDILPYIDQIKDLKRSFNLVYTIDWKCCLNFEEKDIV